MHRPPTNRRTRAIRPPRHDKRARLRKRTAVPRARLPPAGRGVNHRVPARLAVVRVDKLLHPRNHVRGALAIAVVAVRVVLDVQHARKRDAVAAPAAAVGYEVLDLRGRAAAVGSREVVGPADEARVGRAGVVAVKLVVDVTSALRGLVGCFSLVAE